MREFSRRLFLAQFAARGRELSADVVIIGGGLGGCAAALGALRSGMQVILTEETDWIGGQLTSQGVPPDEHRWIESVGSTRSYRAWRTGVRNYYRRNYPMTAAARDLAAISPGSGSVSYFTCEPRVSLEVLQEMLSPWLSGGQLTLLLKHKPVAADVDGDTVRGVRLRSLESGNELSVAGKYILDATELGDLLPMTRTEYVTGFESQKQTGEMHAPDKAQPDNVQAFTMCFSLDYRKGEDHTIDKPEEYDFWRDYVPALKPAWPGKLLSWTVSSSRDLTPRLSKVDPAGPAVPGELNLWRYRRIIAKEYFAPGAIESDISLVNWPQNDYLPGSLIDVSEEEFQKHIRRSKQLNLSLLYWMQTEGQLRGLRIRTDESGTEDGMAKYPYVRESRRIQAEFTVTERHVTEPAVFPDSVGIGSYRIDLHPTTGGDNYIDIASQPFQIPMGALIPKRMENLLPACKNLGVTHITNGCYRLHPVEWNIGEAAGTLAAFCIRTGSRPRQVRGTEKLLKQFQAQIVKQGIELEWPRFSLR